MAAKQVQVIVVGNSTSAQAALKSLQGEAATTGSRLTTLGKRMQSWGSSMSSAGSTLTRSVTLPLAVAGVGMVKLASDAAETENKTRVVFGNMAADVIKWSNTSIDKMGLASATAQDMVGQFGLLFQAAKLPGGEVVKLSKDFVQLSADVSSFYDVGHEEALMALRSGLTGEAEPLRRFGVFLSEATVEAEALRIGLVETTTDTLELRKAHLDAIEAQRDYTAAVKEHGEKSLEAQQSLVELKDAQRDVDEAAEGVNVELTEQQKVVARASVIQESLTKASGDYARTAESTANRARDLGERYKEIGAKIGKDLLPLANDLLDLAGDLADWLGELDPATRQWGLKIAGVAAVTGPFLRILGPFVSMTGRLAGWLPKVVPWLVKWGLIKSLPTPMAPVAPVGGPGRGPTPVVTGSPGGGGPSGFLGGPGRVLGIGAIAYATLGASTVPEQSDLEMIEQYAERSDKLRMAVYGVDTAQKALARDVEFLNGVFAEQGSETRVNTRAFQIAAKTGASYGEVVGDLGYALRIMDDRMADALIDTMGAAPRFTEREKTAIGKLAAELANLGGKLTASDRRQLELIATHGQASTAVTFLQTRIDRQREALERQEAATRKVEEANERLAEKFGLAGIKADALRGDLEGTGKAADTARGKTDLLKDEMNRIPKEIRTRFNVDTAAARAEIRELLAAAQAVADAVAGIAGGSPSGGGGGGDPRDRDRSDRGRTLTIDRRRFAREREREVVLSGR